MNVMQTELQPARGQNETRLRRELDLPPRLPRHHLEFNLGNKRRANRKLATPNCSTSSNYRSAGRGRGTLSSTLLTTTTSRNYISRSGTKTNTGPGSSAIESASGIVLAITTGRGDARSEVGIAALNLRCPHLILCQISDSQTYTNALRKLYLFDPMEILMPDTMCERAAGKGILYQSIVDKFPELEVMPISRVHFNDTIGLERVKTLCIAEYSSVELYVKQKYYALAAAAALLKYVEYTRRFVYVPRSMKIEFQGSPNATIIDLESARSLELVQSQCGQRNVSLLGVLDRCSTPMGRKLLRANILQPPCEEHIIIERQSAVAEMASNRSLRALVQPILRRLYGADRLLALTATPVLQENSVQCAEQNLNYVLLLKNLLDVVPELGGILSAGECDLLCRIRRKLENCEFRSIRERILETIHPDARSVGGYTSSNMQRCFAIKAGINDLLDIARQTYCELIDDMKTMVENLSSKYNLILSLNCNASLGYHVQAILPRNINTDSFELPLEFIEVRKNRRVYTMTTSALATLSQQCKIACEELHLMSNVLLCDLLRSIRGHIGCLFQLSVDVAELDLVASLAQVSTLQMYARPTFGPKLELLDSRHPVMEVFGLDGPVPNDVNASTAYNFSVISGPNMSGKSTYLKQIVLLHIMAQIGCFVPAKKAMFRITNFIFCKIAVRDDIECNASTFTLEMKEAQYILRSVTPSSLIVLDELCKGTAIEEGASIAWAICEQLLSTTAFVFAATHFFYLTKLEDLYCNVTNYHFVTTDAREAGEETWRLIYTHRLKLGVVPSDDYGIVLAELSGLPKAVTEKARRFASDRLTADRVATKTDSREKLCYKIVVELYELLETDRFNQERVITLINRILKIQKQQPRSNRMEEERNIEKIKGSAWEEKRIEDKFSRKSVPETVYSNRSSNLIRRQTQGTVSQGNANFKVVSLLSSNVSRVTYDTHASTAPLQSENLNFTKSSNDLLREKPYASIDRLFQSMDSSSFYSAISKNNVSLNELDKYTSVSNKITSETTDSKLRSVANSMCSTIGETDLSLPLTHESSSMRAPMSVGRSVSELYEYCLSNSDFEPFSISRTTSICTDTLIPTNEHE
ncbi:mutS protein homolog 4 [Osmia lignaria lignaria]|uniref:mutS protein homolog 4 n=1 Tax=Osmia lignaria lignaria TaxID=1437193 RepID=UPI001478B391|nr:mutS protein homolog 4-like [Osmia lignaria]